MMCWVARYASHPRVIRWLARNPPPPEWRGTLAEWAYTEMAFAPGTLLGDVIDWWREEWAP